MPLGNDPYQDLGLQAKQVATMILLVEPLNLSTWLGLPYPNLITNGKISLPLKLPNLIWEYQSSLRI